MQKSVSQSVWPFFSYIFIHSLLLLCLCPLLSLHHADLLKNVLTHTTLHIPKVVSWFLSMTLTSLWSLLCSFAEEVTLFCREEYRVSCLFPACTFPTPLNPSVVPVLSTHTLAHQFVLPIYQPLSTSTKCTHTQTHIYRWFAQICGWVALGNKNNIVNFLLNCRHHVPRQPSHHSCWCGIGCSLEQVRSNYWPWLRAKEGLKSVISFIQGVKDRAGQARGRR